MMISSSSSAAVNGSLRMPRSLMISRVLIYPRSERTCVQFAADLTHGLVQSQIPSLPIGIREIRAGFRRVWVIPIRKAPAAMFADSPHSRDALDFLLPIREFTTTVDIEGSLGDSIGSDGREFDQAL